MRLNTVEVVFFPVMKNQALGAKTTLHLPLVPHETPRMTAERVLSRRYKVRDYLIMEARPVKTPLFGPGISREDVDEGEGLVDDGYSQEPEEERLQ